MHTRRDLLRLSALATATGCALRLPSTAFAANTHLQYGVQLYTVRKEAQADLPNLLRALRQIGFTQIELHPIVFTQPAANLRQMITDAGLSVPATHISAKDFDSQLDFTKKLGVQYVVTGIPGPPTTLDEYHAVATRFNQCGTAARNHGLEFAYFFHGRVFLPQQDSSGFNELIRNTDPALVKLEVDIYWLVQAGLDPAAFLRTHRDRVRLLHIKDRIPNVPTSYADDASADHVTEVGKGTIPWPALLKQARQQGIKYVFIDEDKTEIPVLESLQQSFTYLQTLKL